MKIQLQNALLAQEVAEAAKLRQAEKARARAAESVEKPNRANDDGQAVKKVPGKAQDGEDGPKQGSRESRKWRYRPDGSLEDDGLKGGPGPSPSIDIKA